MTHKLQRVRLGAKSFHYDTSAVITPCRSMGVSIQRKTYIPGLVMSSTNISRSCSCDHGIGTEDSLFVRHKGKRTALSHCLCIACTGNYIYLVLNFQNKTCCPLHKKCEMSAECSRSSQLNVTKVLTELQVRQCWPDHSSQEHSVQCCSPAHAWAMSL